MRSMSNVAAIAKTFARRLAAYKCRHLPYDSWPELERGCPRRDKESTEVPRQAEKDGAKLARLTAEVEQNPSRACPAPHQRVRLRRLPEPRLFLLRRSERKLV